MVLRAWYRITAQAGGDVAELIIYDEIGKSFWNDEAIPAKQVLTELQALPDSVRTLKVRVNSPGGDPFDATAIANALRAQRTEKGRAVETSIEGLAASAATIVTSAGDPIRIADNALMLVHNPFAVVVGDARDMRKMAEDLDRVRSGMIATYRWISPLDEDALAALMDAETWMNADEAIANGFATEKVETVKAAAAFRPDVLDRLGTIPERYRAWVEALVVRPAPPSPSPTPASAAEVLRACRAANALELAEILIEAQATLEQVAARITAAVEARGHAEARAREIRALCAAAKLPELADGYIRGGMAVAEARTHLLTLAAKLDSLEIDGSLRPDPERQAAAKAALNPTAVYAARTKRS